MGYQEELTEIQNELRKAFEEYKKGRLETWARFSKDKGIAPPTDEEIKKDYDKFYRRK